MAKTYLWSVNSLRKRSVPNFTEAVFDVHWTYTGTDELGRVFSIMGTTVFPPETLSPSNFVPFPELTEEIVAGWLSAQPSAAMLQERISQQLALLDNPPEEVPFDRLPWVAQG